jgi:hypothetical protein
MLVATFISLSLYGSAAVSTIGGQTLARRKPYKNDTRKPSNRIRSKRICKYKAIIKCKQGINKQLLNVKVIN